MSNSDYGLTQIIEGIIKGLPLSNISPNSSVGIVFEIILGIILSIKDVTNAKYHYSWTVSSNFSLVELFYQHDSLDYRFSDT